MCLTGNLWFNYDVSFSLFTFVNKIRYKLLDNNITTRGKGGWSSGLERGNISEKFRIRTLPFTLKKNDKNFTWLKMNKLLDTWIEFVSLSVCLNLVCHLIKTNMNSILHSINVHTYFNLGSIILKLKCLRKNSNFLNLT